jgi:uncharacterized membrane protein YbhN (UPF0104 family)
VANLIVPRRIAASFVGVLVLLACGVYIGQNFRWREAFVLLSAADLAWFWAGGAGIVAFWTMRALRWHLLLRGMQAGARFGELYLCCAVALSLSAFTPFQSGELLKVELLKKYGHVARLPGYSALLLERVADLYAIVVMGAVAAMFRLGSLSHGATALVAMLLLALPVAAYVLLHRLRLHGRLGQVVGQIQGGVNSPAVLCMVMVLTFLGWAMIALAWQACFVSLSIAFGFIDMLGLLSLITLASILSFIPGGIGIAEAGITEVLIGHGIDAPLAQAGALLLRALSFLVIAMGAFHWLLLRLRPEKASRS